MKIKEEKFRQIVKEEIGKIISESSLIDTLVGSLVDVRMQVENGDFDDARYTVDRIKELIDEVENERNADPMDQLIPDDERFGYNAPETDAQRQFNQGPPWGQGS